MTPPDATPPAGTPKKASRPPKAPAKKQEAAAKTPATKLPAKKAVAKKAVAKKAVPGEKAAPAKKEASKKAAPVKRAAVKRPPAKKAAPATRAAATPGATPTPPTDPVPATTEGRPAAEHVYDVVVVGAGPAGSACGYWLAEAGWDVVVVEKKQFPREKTCGDGLTPRGVRQLADMGLEGALAGSHRYTGLRAVGFGRTMEMRWPQHPNFPDYGYIITRHDLDGLVAARAEAAGATVLQGTEVVAPLVDDSVAPTQPLPTLSGVSVKDKTGGSHAPSRGATWWWPTAPTHGWGACSGRPGAGTCRSAWLSGATTDRTATTTSSLSRTSTSAMPRATSCRATGGSSPWATGG